MVVVADAGMLWAANLNALEDAGFSFIVGSRLTKAPCNLAEHFERRGNFIVDGQILQSHQAMGTGKAARSRRIVYRLRFKRNKHDDKAINAMVERAEKFAGLKGYVTNLPIETMDGDAVIDAYHDLWHVEEFFRMTRSDLRARPVFHHQREAIEAHLTNVFAALAVSRHLQEATGVTIKKDRSDPTHRTISDHRDQRPTN